MRLNGKICALKQLMAAYHSVRVLQTDVRPSQCVKGVRARGV